MYVFFLNAKITIFCYYTKQRVCVGRGRGGERVAVAGGKLRGIALSNNATAKTLLFKEITAPVLAMYSGNC